jgi:hypothetical protein
LPSLDDRVKSGIRWPRVGKRPVAVTLTLPISACGMVILPMVQAGAVLARHHFDPLFIEDDPIDQGISRFECPVRLTYLAKS